MWKFFMQKYFYICFYGSNEKGEGCFSLHFILVFSFLFLSCTSFPPSLSKWQNEKVDKEAEKEETIKKDNKTTVRQK